MKSLLPELRIGQYEPRFPIIQGGMGVMVSGPKLAGAVAAAGGVGTIASVGLASSLPDMGGKEFFKKNIDLLKKFIADAKVAAKGGLVAVNAMCALTDYDDHIRASCDGGADIIISGAGLPLHLPELTESRKDIALIPIISSVKAANIIVSRWKKRYGRRPDAFVVETPNSAGGHLGARDETEAMNCDLSLEKVVPELVRYLREVGLPIPVIAAGGIWDGEDMAKAFTMGAKGVQMGTRFAATVEGDTSDRFKQAYVDADDSDVVLIKSPCGLPGRAIRNPFVEKYLDGMLEKASCSVGCLSHCVCRIKHETFCIADALVKAYRGDWENGLFFCGSNVGKVKSIENVASLMKELVDGCLSAMEESVPDQGRHEKHIITA